MKHLCDIVLKAGDIKFLDSDNYFLDDKHIIDLLKKECSPYTTNDNFGVLVYVSKAQAEPKYLLSTSIGNGSETAFDFKGFRILDDSKLPQVLRQYCTPALVADTKGAINYMSKSEYDALGI